MLHIGLVFELRRAETLPGQGVRVTGSMLELGCWDPYGADDPRPEAATNAQQLLTGILSYPCWVMSEPLWLKLTEEGPEARHGSGRCTLPSGKQIRLDSSMMAGSDLPGARTMDVEYKYVKETRALAEDGGPTYKWEDRIPNRTVRVPQEPGSIWLVSDVAWNVDHPPRIKRIAKSEVASRRSRLLQEQVASMGSPKLFKRNLTYNDLDVLLPYDIEDEFEALADADLPCNMEGRLEALAEIKPLPMGPAEPKTAAGQDVDVADLLEENARLKADKESAEEQIRSHRKEMALLKAHMQALLESLRNSHAAPTDKPTGLTVLPG